MSEHTDLMAEADNVVRLTGRGTRLPLAEAGAIEAQIFILRVRRRLVIDWMSGEATHGEIHRSIERGEIKS